MPKPEAALHNSCDWTLSAWREAAIALCSEDSLIVAGRLAPTDRGRQGLPRTPSATAGRAQHASPISPPIFRVD